MNQKDFLNQIHFRFGKVLCFILKGIISFYIGKFVGQLIRVLLVLIESTRYAIVMVTYPDETYKNARICQI